MSLKYPSANHLHGLDHVITDDDETLVRRLIGKQQMPDEDQQLILEVLGLEGPETTATPRRKPAPKGATTSHCDKHDLERHYMPGSGWRCPQCHRDNQKAYHQRKREAR